MKTSLLVLSVSAVAAFMFFSCGEDSSEEDPCKDGYTHCVNRCVDLMTDFYDCGECGNECDEGVMCVEGVCGGTPSVPDSDHDSAADSACKDDAVQYEAEEVEHSGGKKIDEGWGLNSKGNISFTHTFFDGETTIVVRAKGDFAGDAWPHSTVKVGGEEVGSFDADSDEWKEFAIVFTAKKGEQEVKISFDNDYYKPEENEDRNMQLESVTIYPCLL